MQDVLPIVTFIKYSSASFEESARMALHADGTATMLSGIDANFAAANAGWSSTLDAVMRQCRFLGLQAFV